VLLGIVYHLFALAVAEKLLYVMPEGCRADMLWLVNMRVSGPFSVFLM
jgi:hypothetical protein